MSFKRIHWGHFLGIASVLFLPLGLYAPRGIAPLYVILAVGFIGLNFFRNQFKDFLKIGRAQLAVILTLPIFGAASAMWSLAPGASLKTAFILGALFLIGSLMIKVSGELDERERLFIEKSILVGGFIGYTLIGIEQVSNAGLSRFLQELVGRHVVMRNDSTSIFNQGMSIGALYLWPFGMVLIRKWSFFAASPILALCAGLIFLSEAQVPGVALVTGAIALLLTRAMPHFAPKVLILGVVIGTLLAPAIPGMLPNPQTNEPSLSKYSDSILHRFIIWQTAKDHILKNPIIGAGLNSTRFLYTKEDRIYYLVEIPSTGRSWGVFSEPIPLHPHNAILQVWMELGLLGAVLLAVFLVAILNQLRLLALPHWETAASFAFFACALTIESISYGAWQSWWLSGLWLSSALVVSTLSPGRTGEAATA